MDITFGKHTGKSSEILVLKHPEYIHWLLQQKNTHGAMRTLQAEVRNLIQEFNGKAIKEKCWCSSCKSEVVRMSVYKEKLDPYWWCANCDPYQAGAVSGKLSIFGDYESALLHVQLYCKGKQSEQRKIIKSLAVAKGLPVRSGEKQAIDFFT